MRLRVAVSGTGTDIGKTFVSLGLLRAASAAGSRVIGLKPVESGGGADFLALQAASTFHVKHPQPYCFDEPISPHLAARHRDTQIDLQRCAHWCLESASDADLALIELPGALLTPLSSAATNADLLHLLACHCWILVVPDRLGVLHETRATLLAAASHKLPAPVVVVNGPDTPDASTLTNAAELERLDICRVAASFARADDQSTSQQAQRLLRALGV